MPSTPQEDPNFLISAWLFATRPHASIAELRQQSQARLVSSIALALLLLFLGSYLPTASLSRVDNPQEVLRLFLLIGLGLSYILSRTPFYMVSGYLLTGLISLSGYAFLLISPTLDTENIFLALGIFTPIAMGIAATLLPPVAIFVITTLHFIAINLLPLIQTSLNQRLAGGFAGGILSLGILLTLLIAYRNRIERENIHILQSANASLKATQANLEERVLERTNELNRRSAQLEAAAQVAHSAAEVRNLQELLDNVTRQITERFGFYHTGIFLIEPNSQYVTLQAASSEGGQRMLARGHRLEIGRQGIVGYAAYQKRPRIAQNVGADAAYFNNPDLPATRSEVALPLEVQDHLIGVLDIQSESDQAFGSDDLRTLQAMADQIALAIENTRLLQTSQNTLTEMSGPSGENTQQAWHDRLGNTTKGYLYTPTGLTAIPSNASIPAENENDPLSLRVPLLLRGKKIGQILLRRKLTEKPWGEAEQEMTDKISAQIALAVENARLLEETQRRALREQTLNKLSGRFSRSLDVELLLQNAARELQRLPQVATVSVLVTPPSNSEDTSPQKA